MSEPRKDPRTGPGVPEPPSGTPRPGPGGLGTGTKDAPEKEPEAQPGEHSKH